MDQKRRRAEETRFLDSKVRNNYIGVVTTLFPDELESLFKNYRNIGYTLPLRVFTGEKATPSGNWVHRAFVTEAQFTRIRHGLIVGKHRIRLTFSQAQLAYNRKYAS